MARKPPISFARLEALVAVGELWVGAMQALADELPDGWESEYVADSDLFQYRCRVQLELEIIRDYGAPLDLQAIAGQPLTAHEARVLRQTLRELESDELVEMTGKTRSVVIRLTPKGRKALEGSG